VCSNGEKIWYYSYYDHREYVFKYHIKSKYRSRWIRENSSWRKLSPGELQELRREWEKERASYTGKKIRPNRKTWGYRKKNKKWKDIPGKTRAI